VVDAANVAYSGQQHNDGKFSFEQIEAVVNKLKERNDGKILVILPQVYTQDMIRNSIKTRMLGILTKEPLAAEDKVPPVRLRLVMMER
jgi:hypothetical protein